MGCAGSKEDLDYDTLSNAVIEEEKRRIQALHQKERQQQPYKPLQEQQRTRSVPYHGAILPAIDQLERQQVEVNREGGQIRHGNIPRQQQDGFSHQAPTSPSRRGIVDHPPPKTMIATTMTTSSPPLTTTPTTTKTTTTTTTTNIPNEKQGFANHLRSVFMRPHDEEHASMFLAPKFEKSDEDVEFLRQAMMKNFLFSNLSERQWKTMLDAFEGVKYFENVEVVRQGEQENYFFVVREGFLHFQVDGVIGDDIGPGQSFGELALLYDSPRAASVICDFPCVLFRVDQKTFRYILHSQRELAEHDKRVLLEGVTFLKDLDETDLRRLADAMVPRRFAADEILATKGDPADTFFIIQEGKVRVTDFDAGLTRYQDHDLGPGDYFGETAMLKDEQRKANFRGKSKGIVISIDKSRFRELIGDFSELLHKSQDKKTLVRTMS